MDGIAALIHGAPVPKQSGRSADHGVKHRATTRCKVRAVGNMAAFIKNASAKIAGQVIAGRHPDRPQLALGINENAPCRRFEAIVRRSLEPPPEAFTTVKGMRVLRWDYLCVEPARHPARDAVPIVDWFIHEQVKVNSTATAPPSRPVRNILLRLSHTFRTKRFEGAGGRGGIAADLSVGGVSESPHASNLQLRLPPLTEQYEIIVAGRHYFADFAYPGKHWSSSSTAHEYGNSRETSQQALIKERDRERAIRQVVSQINVSRALFHSDP